MSDQLTERRLAAIILGDVVGYSRLMGADEIGTMTALKAHRQEVVLPALAAYRARMVDSPGDSMLMEFGSAVSAVSCAITIQRSMLARNEEIPSERRLLFRLGINLGDIVVDGDKIFGDGINVAARLESLCEPGGVCISRSIEEQIRGRLQYPFVDDGEQTLKNILHPVRIFRLPTDFIATLPEPKLPTAPPSVTAAPPSITAVQQPLLPGAVLNDTYKIDALVGSGGMGEIFRAHEIHSGGLVAVKMIRPDMIDNKTAAALFYKEALVLKDVNHDAIVRYYSFSFDPALRRHYLAMEFVDGLSLPKLLQGGALPFEAVSALRRRLASGLQVAHDRGVIHRDLSSDNVIVPQRDVTRAKIIDFGIAKAREIGGETIIGDGFAGKYNYVSPEQLGLSGGEITPKSDIYSFGLVLAEAILGRPIDMGGSQAEVLDKRRLVPDLGGVDPRLRPLLERMLQPDPNQRPSSMEEIATWTIPQEVTRALPEPEPSRQVEPRTLVLEPEPLVSEPEPIAFEPEPLPFEPKPLAFEPKPLVFESKPPAVGPSPAPRPAVRRVEPKPRPVEHWIIGGALALVVLGGGGLAIYETMFQQHKVEPPPPPPPHTVVDRANEFIRAYGSGACFLAVPVKLTETTAAIDGFAPAKTAFDDFDKAFSTTVGFSPDIVGNRIWSHQCPALDFIRQADAESPPVLFLKSTKVSRGQSLAGDVHAPPGQVVTLLQVQEDGSVIDKSPALKKDGEAQAFDLTVTHEGGAGPFPQLLLALTSPHPLEALAQPDAQSADRLFGALLDEAKARGDKLGATAKLFLVTQ